MSELEDYREAVVDPTCTLAHYFEPVRALELDGASTEAFELVEVTIDGQPLRARRSARTGVQTYIVALPSKDPAGREATISYTYRVLVQQSGHLLHLDIGKPTKGLRVQFAYGNCGIRHVNVLDYIAGEPASRPLSAPGFRADPEYRVALRRLDSAQGGRGVRVGARQRDGPRRGGLVSVEPRK